MTRDETADQIARKADRIRRRRRQPTEWRHLAQVGVLGWVFILPIITCSWLGHWIGARSGHLWPAVVGVVIGVALGIYLVWRNVRESLLDTEDRTDEEPDGEEPPGG